MDGELDPVVGVARPAVAPQDDPADTELAQDADGLSSGVVHDGFDRISSRIQREAKPQSERVLCPDTVPTTA